MGALSRGGRSPMVHPPRPWYENDGVPHGGLWRGMRTLNRCTHTCEYARASIHVEYAQVWDAWGTQMNTFWNSHCLPPWNNWSIGQHRTMLCTPSNNPQESWHKQITQSKLLEHGASTEHFLTVGIPQLIMLDGIYIPNTLIFSVSMHLNIQLRVCAHT